MKFKEDIYNMPLHTWAGPAKGIRVLRVPGGWIYYIDMGHNTQTFVPYSEEFAEKMTVEQIMELTKKMEITKEEIK